MHRAHNECVDRARAELSSLQPRPPSLPLLACIFLLVTSCTVCQEVPPLGTSSAVAVDMLNFCITIFSSSLETEWSPWLLSCWPAHRARGFCGPNWLVLGWSLWFHPRDCTCPAPRSLANCLSASERILLSPIVCGQPRVSLFRFTHFPWHLLSKSSSHK